MVVAVGWASQVRASLSGVSDLTVAGTVEAVAVVRAVAGARVERAVVASPASIALASEVVLRANTVAGAVIRANLGGAILALEAGVAVADTVVTEARV